MNRQNLEGRRLRGGIVGGGSGAFIGPVHRVAAELDGQAQVVAGALSADPEKAAASAKNWFLERSYADFHEMAAQESQREDGIDFVIVATPNHLHYEVARTFLEAGINVVCDKPITYSLEEAQALVRLVKSKPVVFALTHNYTGYPMVRQAREMVRQGVLGDIRKVLVEYVQDWLMTPLEQSGNKQAEWRTDPQRSGMAGCVGDIGTHAENLLEWISGQPISALCADVSTFVAGRALDDDANILLRLANGGKGILTCSQIAAGEENGLSIRLYGTKAGLEWRQQDQNSLILKQPGQPTQILRTAQPYLTEAGQQAGRLPAGHPEGFYEAFANIYRAAFADMRRLAAGQSLQGGYPTVRDGLRGMQFVTTVIESGRQGGVWLNMPGQS